MEFHYLFLAGSNPSLSLAELLHSPFLPQEKKLLAGNQDFFLFSFPSELTNPQSLLDKLGGTVKIAKVRGKIKPADATNEIVAIVKERYTLVQKKVRYGLSFYSKFRIAEKVIFSTVKKALKAENISSRFVNNKTECLNAAVINHEKLLAKDGIDIVFCEAKKTLWIGETVASQNIDQYSLRDYEKPIRDMKQGIMPPKLAQIMLNLAGIRMNKAQSKTIWDPFCGSGVVLMEGLLMNYHMLGSDLNQKALRDSEENIVWLREHFPFQRLAELFAHDATAAAPEQLEFDAIVTESYLGPAQTFVPNQRTVATISDELAKLHSRFFRSIQPLLQKKTPIVICFPFFRLEKEDVFLQKSLESVLKLGYKASNLIDVDIQKKLGLTVTPRNSLLYFRKDQRVGREVFCFI